MPPLQSRWILAEPPSSGSHSGAAGPDAAAGAGEINDLALEFGLAPLVIRLAMKRGFSDPEALGRYLQPRLQDLSDPFLMPGMEAAVERVLRAADGGEHVVIYGDYDVDGVTSLAFLHKVLNAFGINPATFLPHRVDQGYGLTMAGIDRILEDFEPRPTLLIAADCGTNSKAEADRLREEGIDLVILDHHEAGETGSAECAALVNPKLGEEFHYLCTGGVVFKLAHALLKTRPLADFDLRECLDLVALATVADIVPLVDENRIFVRRGLAQLERTSNLGLRALKSIAGVQSPIRSHDVGFKIGPRLNAAGRLDTAQDSLDLLLAEDPLTARDCARQLEQRNRDRQKLEQDTRDLAEAMVANLPAEEREAAIVAGGDGWHPGVVGIVASRVCRQYHRPTFIVGFDENGLGKGSGRSVSGVSLVEALDACRDLLVTGGGHDMAAGLSIHKENFDEFRRRFHDHIAQAVAAANDVPDANGKAKDLLEAVLRIDAEVTFPELTLDLLDSYELLRPFGTGNPQPLLMSTGVTLVGEPRVIKDKHLKLRLQQGSEIHDAIWFGAAERDLPRPPWDIAFTIDRNEWRGNVSVSVMIQDVRAAQERGPANASADSMRTSNNVADTTSAAAVSGP
jgi:single-stranded-DNA-specific exonuclease